MPSRRRKSKLGRFAVTWVAAAVLMMSGPASAVIVETATSLVDTNTNLEWVKWTEFYQISYATGDERRCQHQRRQHQEEPDRRATLPARAFHRYPSSLSRSRSSSSSSGTSWARNARCPRLQASSSRRSA